MYRLPSTLPHINTKGLPSSLKHFSIGKIFTQNIRTHTSSPKIEHTIPRNMLHSRLTHFENDNRAMDAISHMNTTPFYSAQFSRNLLTSSSLNTCYADTTTFRKKLVLDGSLSMELNPQCNVSQRGIPRPSIHALLHNPETIQDIHLKYIQAGANVITTANFSCVPHFLKDIDYQLNSAPYGTKSSDLASLSDHLVQLSGQLALSAKEQAIQEGHDSDSLLIAGCIPPVYDATFLYKKYEIMSESEQTKLIESIVDKLNPYVDLFLCESLVCIQQAELAAGIAMKTGKPVWVSWQLNDTPYTVPLLFSCETLAQGVDRLLNSLPRFIDAYLFNCSSPTIISASLPLLRRITRRPIGAYARLPLPSTTEASFFKSKNQQMSNQQYYQHQHEYEVQPHGKCNKIHDELNMPAFNPQYQKNNVQRNIDGQLMDPIVDPVTREVLETGEQRAFNDTITMKTRTQKEINALDNTQVTVDDEIEDLSKYI